MRDNFGFTSQQRRWPLETVVMSPPRLEKDLKDREIFTEGETS
jgi:hypothetical protein